MVIYANGKVPKSERANIDIEIQFVKNRVAIFTFCRIYGIIKLIGKLEFDEGVDLMGLFDIFKKKQVKLTEEQLKWNKMWELWAEAKVEAPYAQLMTYQSEVNNGGHDQYFTNVENITDLQQEISILETILPIKHLNNYQTAHKAYIALEEDDHAAEVLEQCDDVFWEYEEEINRILENYAATIVL